MIMEYYRQSKSKKLQAMREEQVEIPLMLNLTLFLHLFLSNCPFHWPWLWWQWSQVGLRLDVMLLTFRMMTLMIPHGLIYSVPCLFPLSLLLVNSSEMHSLPCRCIYTPHCACEETSLDSWTVWLWHSNISHPSTSYARLHAWSSSWLKQWSHDLLICISLRLCESTFCLPCFLWSICPSINLYLSDTSSTWQRAFTITHLLWGFSH